MKKSRVPTNFKKRRKTFIRAWRKHRDISLERLAERIGITHGQLSRIERGLQPYSQDVLEALAQELQCDVPDLLMRDPVDPEGIWSVWDNLKEPQKKQAVDVLKVLAKTA